MNAEKLEKMEAQGTAAGISREMLGEIQRLRAEISTMQDSLREVEERAARLLRARNAMAVRCAQLQLEMAELRKEVDVEAARASA